MPAEVDGAPPVGHSLTVSGAAKNRVGGRSRGSPSTPRPAAGLKAKQQRFVDEYLKDCNATQAAIRAGYAAKNADVTGPRLLGTVGVKAAVQVGLDKLQERTGISAAYVLEGLREVSQRCLTAKPVMVRSGKDIVQKTDEEGEGVWEFDSSGANRSLELLGKHLKLFTDVVEHQGRLTLEQLVSGSLPSAEVK